MPILVPSRIFTACSIKGLFSKGDEWVWRVRKHNVKVLYQVMGEPSNVMDFKTDSHKCSWNCASNSRTVKEAFHLKGVWNIYLRKFVIYLASHCIFAGAAVQSLKDSCQWMQIREVEEKDKCVRSKAPEVKPGRYMQGRTIPGWAPLPATIHTARHASTCTASHNTEGVNLHVITQRLHTPRSAATWTPWLTVWPHEQNKAPDVLRANPYCTVVDLLTVTMGR